ncbi:helix-turn-helix transcriptional regulator [Alistipes sp.]|uniref:helix-turn-helix domain-containing protein n=1 Tax=Alistipes sp. TaxID=1872444 RepID=UPI0025C064E4|nr:helix-turn-helix transcriptional regulator [Alistipes sp.]
MSDIQRIKKVINWLIFQEVAESEKQLADLLGYTKSSFSQIVNGKVPLSEKFVKKLCGLDENINEVWVLKGEGSMFKNNPNGLQMVEIPREAWSVIQTQAESLSARDRQIDELVGLLKDQLRESKKTDVRQGGSVTSAVAG